MDALVGLRRAENGRKQMAFVAGEQRIKTNRLLFKTNCCWAKAEARRCGCCCYLPFIRSCDDDDDDDEGSQLQARISAAAAHDGILHLM